MIMANSCETCKHYEVEAYNEPCVSCRFRDYDVPTKWENPFKQKTNADRIRAMSDEELAEFLVVANPTNCIECAFSCGWRCQPDRQDYSDTEKCVEGKKRWLKQPVEVND
jgi:hypothetical protein